MVITTLSAKHQTTLGAEIVKSLKLEPGTRLKQYMEGDRIIIEPLDDVMTAFGSVKTSVPFISIAHETSVAEEGIAEDAMKSMRDA